MKIDDKNIEHILRDLADFKPASNPDWESFYNKNKKDIEASAKIRTKSGYRRITSSVRFRNTLTALGFIIGIFAVFYFFYDTSSDERIEESVPVVIDNDENVAPFGKISRESENTIGSEPTEDIQANGNDNLIVEPGLNSENTIPETDNSNNAGETEANPVDHRKTSGTDVDSTNNQPVILKKTVIINDTIRIAKPVKKVK
nr:hypothetical protein [Bacteroidota bacterium]